MSVYPPPSADILHGTPDENAPDAIEATPVEWGKLLGPILALGIGSHSIKISAKMPEFGNFHFAVYPSANLRSAMLTIAQQWATEMKWWKVEVVLDPEYNEIKLNAYMRRFLKKPF